MLPPPTRLEMLIGMRINWKIFSCYVGTGHHAHLNNDTDDEQSFDSEEV